MVTLLLACASPGSLGTEALDDGADPSAWAGDDGESAAEREDRGRGDGVLGDAVEDTLEEECPPPTECVELAEAVDRGHATLEMARQGLGVTIHADYTFCVDDMLTLTSATSQDAIGGTTSRTETSREETLWLTYAAWGSEAGWWCIEPDQYTAIGAAYDFDGAHAPTALEWRAQTETDLDDDGAEDHLQQNPLGTQTQYNIWDFEAVSPILVVGRSVNYLRMDQGDTAHVVIQVRNLGRVAGGGYVQERFPPGRVPLRYDVEPDAIETASDGTITATWFVDLDAAIPVHDGQAVYGQRQLGYELRYDRACSGRDVGPWPEVTFTAADGQTYRSRGSSLVVECCGSERPLGGPG